MSTKATTFGLTTRIDVTGIAWAELHIVPAEDRSFYQPSETPQLTLVTCYPFYYVGAAPQRFIVRAELIGQ